ncbi:hypothetical protein B2J93_731 [Marssonina coronariae]|uniref:Homeobox domain-containing protein n=1 Tax=Diplocarpon coronariae TaxID=2795749 RepID=A0A218YYF5_9HELO|nr:hypothetical protein B2J93_731 [Marssonina coronariae]
MSNFEPLAVQPEWREQYPAYSLHGGHSVQQQQQQPSYEQSTATSLSGNGPGQSSVGARPALEHRYSSGSSRQDGQPLSATERPDAALGDCTRTVKPKCDDPLVSPQSTAPSLLSNRVSSASSITLQQGTPVSNGSSDGDVKDEDEDLDDDDDMIDAEREEGAPPLTAAERRAERRKMKRFRLTHQQTRFLMSEFAKQAHPDAAHRERLSREIPGLSPRQVQVWFQNRRAKIKRLTADDRDRMMKMRAVPDDFDNVQALHSPYGAVHGVGTPMQVPVDFSPGYTDPMMRPLMVDTMRRNEGEDSLSPAGLSPAYSHVGFPGGMGNPDILSPTSMNSSDRYYPSHASSPMSGGPRSSNPFDRQSSYPQLPHSRQHVRPLQPLQLRETMNRSRPDANSPLRSSMSWKGETLDYNSYQTGQSSPSAGGRQQSSYQPEQAGNTSSNAHQYDANGNSYSGSNPGTQSPSAHMTYPPSHNGSSHQQPASAMSHLRGASSATFPTGLDMRTQYRGIASPSPNPNPSPNQSPLGVTPRGSTFSQAFTSGYASAPLTAPSDFSLPRTPADAAHGARDYNPHLSASMAPPHDFSHAYSSNGHGANHVHSPRAQQHARAYSREQHSASPRSPHEEQPSRNGGEMSYLRSGEYGSTQKRDVPETFHSP